MAGTDGRRIRVVVADDSPSVRTWLRDRLRAEPDLDVVGTGWNGMEALRLVHQLEPDVLVLDEGMDDVPGPEIAAHLSVAGMRLRVVLYAIDELEGDSVTGSRAVQRVLDSGSAAALVTAIRRPRREERTARQN